jgi:hypothetical protein
MELANAEKRFWKWFVEHENELLDCEADIKARFDKLHSALLRVHPDLVFEFGPKGPRREFVISAGGIKSAFSAVASLVAAAPDLPRWRIIAFRPRRETIDRVQIGSTQVDPNDVAFSLLTRGAQIGLCLYLPGFSEENAALKQIAYLMLDEALGEYDVETKIGLIRMLSSESPAEYQRYALPELPRLFDELTLKLQGHGPVN